MATVLITRPLPDAMRLAALLEGLGYKTFVEPMLSVEPVAEPIPDGVFDAVMVTSPNAMAHLPDNIGHLLALPCFCVGERSAATAIEAGFRDVKAAAGNGLDLAAAMRTVIGPGKSVLHIAGADVASDGRDQLHQWGYMVAAWVVYRTVAHVKLTHELRLALAGNHIDAALFFSPKTATAFVGLAAVEACCEGLTAIGLSQAVAVVLKALPWREIAVAELPTEQAMVTRLQKLFPPN